MKISTTSGHLTATDKKVIKYLLSQDALTGSTKKRSYSISISENGYNVAISYKTRGIGLGGALRMETFKATFIIK